MRTTLEIVASRTTTNSSIHEIEVRRTTTKYCSNHWFIVFRHQGGNTSANVFKRLDAVEWTENIDLHPSDFVVAFNIIDKFLGIQNLATSISILEGYSYPETAAYCCCSQWV